MTIPVHASQFFLGPDYPSGLTDWQRVEIAPDLRLAAHPTLTVSRCGDASRSLTLLGFILDPDDSAARDIEILDRLLARFTGIEALIDATMRLGGRWVIIAVHQDRRWLFHDALGLRTVFYTERTATGAIYAMSQPGLARDVLGLPFDSAAQRYMDTHVFRSNLEYRWPGTATPLEGLSHLLPNHLLDLVTGTVTRYWPRGRSDARDIRRAMDDIAQLMQGLIAAAAARFDLALSLTAGLDSRLVLAAARPVRNRLTYVTVRQAKMPDGHADIVVSAQLLKSLGLPHTIVAAAHGMSAEFAYAFKRNVFLSHDHYGADAEAIFSRFRRQKVAMVGSGGEVGRCYTRVSRLRSLFTPIEVALAKSEIGEADAFAVQHYRKWLNGLRSVPETISLYDLLEWEQGHGNWVAMTELEFDIAWRDIFSPYNCRAVLATMLRVDERFRKGPRYRLFEMLIEKLWPQVLAAPVNPHRSSSILARFSPRRLAAVMRLHWLEAILAAAAGAAGALILAE